MNTRDEEFLLQEKYAGEKLPAYEADCVRLKNGEPLAYIIGWVPFLDTKIFLDSHPLIPRSETEFWAEKTIEEVRLRDTRSTLRVLDLFAGSGCIGVATLKHIPNVYVDFGEIDVTHFPTIQKNIQQNLLPSQSRTSDVRLWEGKIIETDVWSGITDTYDVVFANPPYLSSERIERIENSVLKHEPKKALFADEDGFALIRKTIEGAAAHMNPGGTLYIEHEPEHAEAIQRSASTQGFSAKTHKDQYGVERYSTLRRL